MKHIYNKRHLLTSLVFLSPFLEGCSYLSVVNLEMLITNKTKDSDSDIEDYEVITKPQVYHDSSLSNWREDIKWVTDWETLYPANKQTQNKKNNCILDKKSIENALTWIQSLSLVREWQYNLVCAVQAIVILNGELVVCTSAYESLCADFSKFLSREKLTQYAYGTGIATAKLGKRLSPLTFGYSEEIGRGIAPLVTTLAGATLAIAVPSSVYKDQDIGPAPSDLVSSLSQHFSNFLMNKELKWGTSIYNRNQFSTCIKDIIEDISYSRPVIVLLIEASLKRHYLTVVGIELDPEDNKNLKYLIVMNANKIGRISYKELKHWMVNPQESSSACYTCIRFSPSTFVYGKDS